MLLQGPLISTRLRGLASLAMVLCPVGGLSAPSPLESCCKNVAVALVKNSMNNIQHLEEIVKGENGMNLSKPGRSFAEAQPQRCSLKTISLPQLVLYVSLVGEVDQTGVVDEEDESRWIYRSLGGVIEL